MIVCQCLWAVGRCLGAPWDKPAWIHGEIRCKNCCKDRTVSGTLFKSEKSLKDHHKCKWKVASRAGTRAERLVISKRKKRAMEVRRKVLMEAEPLNPVRLLKFSLFRPVWCNGPFTRYEIRKKVRSNVFLAWENIRCLDIPDLVRFQKSMHKRSRNRISNPRPYGLDF